MHATVVLAQVMRLRPGSAPAPTPNRTVHSRWTKPKGSKISAAVRLIAPVPEALVHADERGGKSEGRIIIEL